MLALRGLTKFSTGGVCLEGNLKGKIKSKVKGIGQECPTHTSRVLPTRVV